MSTPHLHSLLITLNWNRLILNILWIVSIVVLASQLLIYEVITLIVPTFTPMSYLSEELFIPHTVFLFIMMVLELCHRLNPRRSEEALIYASLALSFMYFYFLNDHFAVAPIVMMFPLLISIIYFKKKYLFICLALSFIGLFITHCYTENRSSSDIVELLITSCFMIIATFTGLAVIRRGSELVAQLDMVQQSEQELRIQTMLMERVVKIDPLTGLHNHKSFHEQFEKLLADQKLHPFPLQIAILDIDNFKMVNDTFGHWAGDIALKHAAACIADHISRKSFAARYGGEEFVILLREDDIQAAWLIIEKLRKAIACIPIPEMNRRHVTLSIGMHAVEVGETKEYAFQQADQALYVSKSEGKNRTTMQ
ncbi:GGDEF domain-containing protein [Paenibacillus sp. LHD-38]|uniref:GGDEF domain-containing protein n=1 Tax=Paenibacillus sp. LHD-38 TaxID=3072143 RepID=UPI0028101A51|nr:GGDEF domain-containing protein [Paenibacillus sp. LHD-38]MDQ8734176.1 GGDEF domain-containing protein [Paenibacillus sp. LHD-38]